MVAVLSAVMSLGVVASAGAWNPLGCKFNTTTPRHLIATNSPVSDLSGAVSSWNSVQSDVTLTAGSVSNYDMVLSSSNFGNTGWSGLTYKNGDITVGPACTSGKWVKGSPASSVNTYYNSSSSANRKGVAIHELGHALGLDHNNSTSTA